MTTKHVVCRVEYQDTLFYGLADFSPGLFGIKMQSPIKNVFQFVLETAHQQILYKVTSTHADILSFLFQGLILSINRKSAPTQETAPLFLYKHVILATHSFSCNRYNAIQGQATNTCTCSSLNSGVTPTEILRAMVEETHYQNSKTLIAVYSVVLHRWVFISVVFAS